MHSAVGKHIVPILLDSEFAFDCLFFAINFDSGLHSRFDLLRNSANPQMSGHYLQRELRGSGEICAIRLPGYCPS